MDTGRGLFALAGIALIVIAVISGVTKIKGPVPAGQIYHPVQTSQPAQAPTVRVLMGHQGSGIWNSDEFEVGGPVLLQYNFDCSGFGQAGNFIAQLSNRAAPVAVLANELATEGSSTTNGYVGLADGPFHLAIISACDWTVRLSEVR